MDDIFTPLWEARGGEPGMITFTSGFRTSRGLRLARARRTLARCA